MTVKEERYALDQLFADAKSGKLREVFACGTAAVVSPIGAFKSKTDSCTINNNTVGDVTARLRQTLCDIQFGRTADPHDWIRTVA